MQSKRHATLFLYLIVASLVSTALSRLEVRKCVEGQTYFDGCNECTCIDERRLCTRNSCKHYDKNFNKGVEVPVKEPPITFWQPIPDAPLPNS